MKILNRFLASTAVITATALIGTAASAATIVNVDGRANTSLTGTNGVDVLLDAGTYTLGFVQDAYTAFNRFGAVSGCNNAGARCASGWEDSVRFIINGTTNFFGDGNASGGGGPQATGGYYSTAAESLAAASRYTTSFTLAAATTVRFYIYDDTVSNNLGGVSVAVNAVDAVPEPATWAMMLVGVGAVGFGMRRRNKVATRVSYAA